MNTSDMIERQREFVFKEHVLRVFSMSLSTAVKLSH
jgi:hypothetical protein